MSCITTGWRKIGWWFAWFWWYLTELLIVLAIIFVIIIAIAAIFQAWPIVAIFAKALWWIFWIYFLLVVAALGICFWIYIIDTLCNFFSNLWNKGWSSAWKGMWNDLKRSFGWFKEEVFDGIYDRFWERVRTYTDIWEKTSKAWIDGAIEKGGEAIDWLKEKWKKFWGN